MRNDEVGPGIQAWQLGTSVDAGDEVDGGAEKSRTRAQLRQQCRRQARVLGRIPREEVGNPRPGLVGTRTLERSEAHEGRRSMVAAMRDVETAKRLDLEDPAERSARMYEARDWPNRPARAAAQVNYRIWRMSIPFAAALKSP